MGWHTWDSAILQEALSRAEPRNFAVTDSNRQWGSSAQHLASALQGCEGTVMALCKPAFVWPIGQVDPNWNLFYVSKEGVMIHAAFHAPDETELAASEAREIESHVGSFSSCPKATI